jgi:hypothetical protein
VKQFNKQQKNKNLILNIALEEIRDEEVSLLGIVD